MPELPEIELYIGALERTIGGQTVRRIRLRSPSLVRTYDPPLSAAVGLRVLGFRRIGKRIAWEMEDDIHLVFHLKLTGRFHWRKAGAALPRHAHAAFDFDEGTLQLTEASTRKLASLHVVRGRDALLDFDPGGVEPLEVDLAGFEAALRAENRTLKRALTDPRIIAGIGQAHSDEILLRARLSPVALTSRLSSQEVERLWQETRSSLREWSERLRKEAGIRFPENATAFHPAMGVHGRYGQPCPQCGTPIQRIVYSERETNYCPTCQTGGRLLADRGLSRLLGKDWPKSLDELEEMRRGRRGAHPPEPGSAGGAGR